MEAPDPSPALGMHALPTLPTVGAILKGAALREMVLSPSGLNVWPHSGKASTHLLDSGMLVQWSTHLVVTPNKPHKVFYLLKLLPISLEWPASSFFILFLFSGYGTSLWISTVCILQVLLNFVAHWTDLILYNIASDILLLFLSWDFLALNKDILNE